VLLFSIGQVVAEQVYLFIKLVCIGWMICSQDGLLLLTSSAWGIPQSALWSMDNFFDQKTGFEVQYMEFSKSVQDRIVGTSESKAYVSYLSIKNIY